MMRRFLSSAAKKRVPVAVVHGDGIGPEIMNSTLEVIDAAGGAVDPVPAPMGLKVYDSGVSSGISDEAWDVIDRTRVILKAPITTPLGGGVKSINVSLRKTLGLFVNVRPCRSFFDGEDGVSKRMDLTIIRENEEDTYGGIEHRQTREVTQCLKLITQPGSERVIRYAFDYASANGRKQVHCMTKSNIMKITDGLFERNFHEIAKEYPEIQATHMVIDIGAARIASQPEAFDVVVTPNLYGDIVSDIAAEVSGSVGLAGSANFGSDYALFEAIHGSAPDIAGLGRANPSGLLVGACKMLAHIGDIDTATTVHRAWMRTIEDGVHTADVFREGRSSELVSTEGFTAAVIARLGQEPRRLKDRKISRTIVRGVPAAPEAVPVKTVVGVDVFVDWDVPGRDPAVLAADLNAAAEGLPVRLSMVSNRGTKVWPGELPATMRVDHWRCRFMAADGDGPAVLSHTDIIDLFARLAEKKIDFIKMETLTEFDGVPGYSKGQGE